jgi:hypothetical protein
VITNVFLADAPRARLVASTYSVPVDLRQVSCEGLEMAKLEWLGRALGCEGDALAEQTASADATTTLVLPISHELTEQLADLSDAALERVAAAWRGGHLALRDGEPGEYAVLRALRDLAREREAPEGLYLLWVTDDAGLSLIQ